MNPFSGSTYLWKLFGEYEHLKVLCWYCKGPLSGSYGPEIGQNCMKYDILGTFQTFSLKKRIGMNTYSGSTFLWSILGEYEPFHILCWLCKGPLSWSYCPKLVVIG